MQTTSSSKFRAASASTGCTVMFAVVAAWLLTRVMQSYGWTLFLGVPFVMGVLCAFWSHRFGLETFREVASVVALSLFTSGSAFLVLGMEGLICLAMATPLCAPFAFLAAYLTHLALRRKPASSGGIVISALLLAPGFTFLPEVAPTLPLETHIVIAAPPEAVWKNIVSFSDLPAPTEWMFRAGLAYPERARIEGRGPGAVRYCQFSTGPFVEPIQVWDEPRLLSFSVTSSPEPMREISPYDIHPAHLDGYFISKHGQFLLTPLSGGRTLLTGTTWYQQKLWPQVYWRPWSDAIVHRIHLRVLTHIKNLSEGKTEQAGGDKRRP